MRKSKRINKSNGSLCRCQLGIRLYICPCPQGPASILKLSLSCICFPTQLIFPTFKHRLNYYSNNLMSTLQLQQKVIETSFDTMTKHSTRHHANLHVQPTDFFYKNMQTSIFYDIQEALQIGRYFSIKIYSENGNYFPFFMKK